MAPMRVVAIYLMAVFLGGALLAPWLYWLVQSGRDLPGLRYLADNPFHRFVNRSILLAALAGLWPFLRALGVRRWSDLGLTRSPQKGLLLGQGIVLGWCSLAVVVSVTLFTGIRVWSPGKTGIAITEHCLSAAAAGVVVALLEEIIFRGALFTALKKTYDWRLALLLSSAVYGILHFFSRPESLGNVTWLSGLALLPRMMRGFGDLHSLIPGFFSLWLAGAILALACEKTGSLYFSIGLHAGWIFWLKSFSFFTRAPRTSGAFWGSNRLIDGWFAVLVLIAVGLGLWQWNAVRDRESGRSGCAN